MVHPGAPGLSAVMLPTKKIIFKRERYLPMPENSPPPRFVNPRRQQFIRPKSRGALPHLYKPGGTYFITFRLFDAIERVAVAAPIAQARDPDKNIAPRTFQSAVKMAPELVVQTFQSATSSPAAPPAIPSEDDESLDPSEIARQSETRITLGSCCLAKAENAEVIHNALRHFHADRYFLHAWCVMPNHVHVVVTPLPPHNLSQVIKSWKGYTARKINALSGNKGTLWEQESFDHLCRRPVYVEFFIRYTLENPVAAGLCQRVEDWPYSGRNS